MFEGFRIKMQIVFCHCRRRVTDNHLDRGHRDPILRGQAHKRMSERMKVGKNVLPPCLTNPLGFNAT